MGQLLVDSNLSDKKLDGPAKQLPQSICSRSVSQDGQFGTTRVGHFQRGMLIQFFNWKKNAVNRKRGMILFNAGESLQGCELYCAVENPTTH